MTMESLHHSTILVVAITTLTTIPTSVTTLATTLTRIDGIENEWTVIIHNVMCGGGGERGDASSPGEDVHHIQLG